MIAHIPKHTQSQCIKWYKGFIVSHKFLERKDLQVFKFATPSKIKENQSVILIFPPGKVNDFLCVIYDYLVYLSILLCYEDSLSFSILPAITFRYRQAKFKERKTMLYSFVTTSDLLKSFFQTLTKVLMKMTCFSFNRRHFRLLFFFLLSKRLSIFPGKHCFTFFIKALIHRFSKIWQG